MVSTVAIARLVPFAVPEDRPRLSGVVYDDAPQSRFHTAHGARVVSVTEVLQLAGKTDFSKVKPEVLQRKGRIGTAAHLAAHFFDEGDLVESSVDPSVAPFFAAWRTFREQRRFEPECLETVIFSHRHGYIGRLDRVGIVDGRRRILLDIKTGDPDAARADLQTVAYELALADEFPDQFGLDALPRWSVQLFPNGHYRVCEYPKAPRTWRHDRAEFLAALADAQLLMGLPWRKPVSLHLVEKSAESPAAPLFDVPDAAVEQPSQVPSDSDNPPPPTDEEMEPPAPTTTDVVTDGTAQPESTVAGELVVEEPPAAPANVLRFVIPDGATEDVEISTLREQKDSVVVEAERLARIVSDGPSCQTAVNFAADVDAVIKEVHRRLDPKVERARAPYQDRLDERREILQPLEQAKDLLTGKAGAVTRFLADQKRLEAERARREQEEADRIAREERQREEAVRQEAERQRREALAAGDRERAAEASQAAQEAERRRDNVVAQTVSFAKPAVTGAVSKAKWEARLEPAGEEGLKELVIGIATPEVLKRLRAQLHGIEGWQESPATAIDALIAHAIDTAPFVPVAAVTPDAKYLGRRAVADRDTLKWPGVRFFDAGQTALSPKRGKQS